MDKLLLLSGDDIPFPAAQLVIHPPTLKEIGYITEEQFWPACQYLKFDKKLLKEEDRIKLENVPNFDILMTILKEKDIGAIKARIQVFSLLAILFPKYQITLEKETLHFKNVDTQDESDINRDNFDVFQEIITEMFCLKNSNNKQYNPDGSLSKKIAQKIMRARQKRAQLAPQKEITILSRYASVLAIGESQDLNIIMNYTIYQLMDQFERYQLKQSYDDWGRWKRVGATGMKDPEDWYKDLYQQNKNKK